MSDLTPIVIAHRGASGYLPEHSLAAKALAHGFGADYLEQDVVLTQDGVPLVLHDLWLEEVTDVARVFAGRARDDGHFYAVDFTLDEVRQLNLLERRAPGSATRLREGRFSADQVRMPVVTLDEELAFIRALNASTGREAGVYTEVKFPAFHRRHGLDASRIVLETLGRHGYRRSTDKAFVQCFDPQELARIRNELHCGLRLVQLIGENAWGDSDADYEAMRGPAGLDAIARVADGIGPWMPQVLNWKPDGTPETTDLVALAHARGLVVHAYTLRCDQLPPHAPDLAAVHAALFGLARVDGLFSDFPDRTLAALRPAGLPCGTG